MINTNRDVYTEMQKNHLTNDLTEIEIRTLRKFSEVVQYEQGDYIMNEGESSQFLYLIEAGNVFLYKNDSEVGKKHLISTLSPGEVFGDRALFEQAGQQQQSAISQGVTSIMKINIAMLFAANHYKDLQATLLNKVAFQLSSELNKKNVHFIARKSEEKKTYQALGVLTISLLTVLSIYTLLLISLTQLVEFIGVSTYVDVSLIVGFALMMGIIMKKSGYSFEEFGVTTKHWKKHSKEAILLTSPILLFFFILKWALITFIPAFSHIPLFNLEATFEDIGFSYPMFAFSVIIYILFSIVQEFIARAGLQSALYKFLPNTKRKVLISIVVSNLLFAMAHSHINIWFALTAFIPGLFWGWMFARQRSIVGVSISHMMIGIWVLFILGFTQFVM
ncbi:CAAX amino terminal protease family protein [Halalkalibacter wakoensis JCM 9140]|uniref:CAAX amino terminal protease family protein n=1 Tax=Halalkalibacter wakoensis JCM 9140 TaxID=1236970 RepID=W4Q0B7_9BACI|nr:cyclic nucleotide-binding domain-containing protein [Halalkalibacter wakoensis]GAE25168.1 CAAX amino terminal protease family protein [Halalkalibacter wakoensis JCM 9140]